MSRVTAWKSKWLKFVPQSPHQVLEVINEANKLFQESKEAKAEAKKEYERKLSAQGIYVGTEVFVIETSDQSLKGHDFVINRIMGNVVTVTREDGQSYRLRNFKFKKVKNNE